MTMSVQIFCKPPHARKEPREKDRGPDFGLQATNDLPSDPQFFP